MEQTGIVTEDNEVRGLGACLSHVVDLQAAALIRGRLNTGGGISQHAVQSTGGDTGRILLFNFLDHGEQAVDALTGEGRQEHDRSISHVSQILTDLLLHVTHAVEDKETNTMRDKELAVRDGLSYMTYAPVVFLSALTGQRVDKLYQVIQDVHAQNTSRITTGALNSVLADATARVQPPTDKGRRLKIYYLTQASTKPPHFVIFCKDARLFHFSYQRYLENQIREVFGLQGTPVRITIRQKGDKEE